MATDVFIQSPTAIPTPFILPEGMAINPFFDYDLFIGVPIWVWIFVAMFIIFVLVIGRWLFRMSKMKAVSGYKDKITSADLKSQQVWYIGVNKTFSIYCLKLQDRILSFYEYLRNLEKWCLSSIDATGSCGGVSMMIVGGGYDQVRDPPAEIGICTIAELFNTTNAYDEKGNPQYLEYVDNEGKKNRRHKIIKDYEDYTFFLPVLERLYPKGVSIQAYCFYNPSKAQQFTPADCSASFFGARRTKVARELRIRMPDQAWYITLAPILVAVACGAIATLFTYMVVTK